MKTTGNLGLKKPDGTDIVDIADLNGNMDILDTAVKAGQDHAADAVKHITATERTAWNAKASTAAATASAAGLMAAADKAKLDGVAAGANLVANPATNGVITINGVNATVYAHPNHTGDVTSTGDGVTAIAPGVIVDADVNSAAGIAWSKLSKTGASLADLPTRSAADLSSGTLSAARLPAISGDITMAAGAGTATITAGAIVNADVNAVAAIDATKIGTGTVSNAEFGYLDGVTSGIQGQLDGKSPVVDYIRQPAYAATSGTGAAYNVTLTPAPASLPEGFGITIVPNLVNTAGPTLNVNGLGAIALKDQKGVAYAAGKLLAGKPYMFRKVGTDFLADSAGGSGNAAAGDIRAGKTAATDAGDVTGTLAVQTGGTVTPGPSAIVKAAGIYDTAITVAGVTVPAANVLAGTTIAGTAGTMVNRSSYTNAQSTGWDGNIMYVRIPQGAYLTNGTSGYPEIQVSATQARADGNIVSSNIRNGTWIYGVQGNMVEGKRTASGTISTGSTASFSGNQGRWIVVSGLTFLPSTILIIGVGMGGTPTTVYRVEKPFNNKEIYLSQLNVSGNAFAANRDDTSLSGMVGVVASYIDASGFKLPLLDSGYGVTSANWFAIE